MRVMGSWLPFPVKRQAADARTNRKRTEDAWSIPLARFHISANQVQTDMMGPQTMKTGRLHIRGVTGMCVLSFS